MSDFLYHEPCPHCGSNDNLGVWDDHKWCFGCGHWEPNGARSLEEVHSKLVPIDVFSEENKYDMSLPQDYGRYIPKEPALWLAQYSLTHEELTNNRIGWSQSNQMLIYPYFGEDNEILCWQGRYFPKRVPKVYTRGFPDKHLLLNVCRNPLLGSSVVVVEDAISAIKVSRVCDSSPVLGANLSLHKAIGLSRLYENLFLWLDNDKAKEMMKFKNKYAHLFNEVKVIISDKDPKFYDENKLFDFLKEA